MRTTLKVFFFFGLIFSCDFALAGTGEVDMGNIIDQYKAVSSQFGDVVTKIAMGVVGTLFTIEVIWSIVQRWGNVDGRFEDVSSYGVIGSVLIKNIMRTGFLYWIINGDILHALVKGFSVIGVQAAGKDIASPSDIFFIGVDIANGLTKGLSENLANAGLIDGALAAMNGILPGIMVGLGCFFIILSFAVMAAQYAVIMIQLYFFLAVYPLLMSFGATRFGKDFAAKQFSTAIVVGIRVLAIYFVVSVAGALGGMLQTGLANLSLDNLSPLWSTVGVACLLGFLAIKLPAMASDMVSGTASLSAGDGVAAGGALGAAAGAVGGAAAGALFGSSASSGSNGTMPLSEAAGLGIGGSGSASVSSLSGMGMSGAYSSPGGAVSDLNPQWFSDPTSSGSSGLGLTNAVGSGSDSVGGGSISGGSNGSEQPAIATSSNSGGGSVEQSSGAAPSNGGNQASSGGSFAGAGANPQNDVSVSSLGEAMQDLAREEQASGGAASVHMGDD